MYVPLRHRLKQHAIVFERVTVVELGREQGLPLALRALRETLNYSQEAWAVLMGVGWRTIMRWEQGRTVPSEHTLVMLRCRLNHEQEAKLWRERLANDPDVFKLLADIGLLEPDGLAPR